MAFGGTTRVVVVGGGCSGTLLAVAMMGPSAGHPCEVVVVDPGETPGRGVAYGTSCSSHVLNVPAEQMSAYPDRPGHFASWAHQRDARVMNRSFAPRMLYGEYLEAAWREARHDAPSGSSLTHRRGRAASVLPSSGGSALRVRLADGSCLDADHVVLAMGNLPPSTRAAGPSGLASSGRYIADPWRAGAFDSVTGPVLLIGTGLTAVDVALALADRGLDSAMHAISRHGLLPRSHRPDAPQVPPLPEAPAERTVRALAALLRRSAFEHRDWRWAIDEFRPHVPEVWRTMPDAERRRFLRHTARLWEVHRHRMAPDVAARVGLLMANRRLSVRAGTIVGWREVPGAVDIELRRRGSRETEAVSVAHVINCTGPQASVSDAGDPFIDSLLAAGYVQPGPYGLGFDVAEDGAVIDAAGVRSQYLSAIGPLRRGVEWETTAAREIRFQAGALAARLASMGTETAEPPDLGVIDRDLERLEADSPMPNVLVVRFVG
jgi:uncharacterized NAD(P)/FAD-binding protein YdhS